MEEERSVILGVVESKNGVVMTEEVLAGACLPSDCEEEGPGGPEKQLLPQDRGQHGHPIPGRKVIEKPSEDKSALFRTMIKWPGSSVYSKTL